MLLALLALAGIAEIRYATHSLVKISTHFCIANAYAIAKSSVWTELKGLFTQSEWRSESDNDQTTSKKDPK